MCANLATVLSWGVTSAAWTAGPGSVEWSSEAPAWLLGDGHFELNPKKRAGSSGFTVLSCLLLQSVTRTSHLPLATPPQ